METRNIVLTLKKAKEWYNSGNEALKEAALQAFTEDELKEFDFRSIKTFKDVLRNIYEGLTDRDIIYKYVHNIRNLSKASAASTKLNIIRKALNKGYEMKFDKGEMWYPCNHLLKGMNNHLNRGDEIQVAKVKINNEIYILTNRADDSSADGLGCFTPYALMGGAYANIGFLGCATKEIAEHFGKYFAKEIFEAKYADFINYEWID